MTILRFAVPISLLSIALSAGAVRAQPYPVKAVRIVTAEAGGGPDISARIIAQGLAAVYDQSVIVDNRGGNVAIPAEIVARSSPDGHSLLLSAGALWLEPFMRDKVPYDPLRDFAPITLATSTPTVLAVPPSLGATSVKDLIALAKSRPGALNYASGPTGSTSHLSAELFKAMAGVDIVRVTYKGTAPALTDLVAGRVQLMFPNAASVLPFVKSGKLRGLAVTGSQPFSLFPELPTVAASGLPGYESLAIFAIFGPATMPRALVMRINQDIARVLRQVEVKDKFANIGVETVGSSPDELAQKMKSEMARLGKVIKEAGIRD